MSSLSEALRLYQDGQYDEAAKRLRILTEFDPRNAQPWLYYGAALGQLGRWGQAVDAYRRVVELLPEEVSAYCDLAEALLQAGRLDHAEDAVQMALSLAPEHPIAVDLHHRVAHAAPSLPQAAGPPKPAAREPVHTAPPGRKPRAPQRLTVLLSILVALLAVVCWRLATLPAQRWRPIIEAAKLLDAAEAEREKLADLPGEDLEQVRKMRELLASAEVRLYPPTGHIGSSPDAAYLRGRLMWCRDRDRFAATNELLDALAKLNQLAPRQRRPLGTTVAELRASSYRFLARIELENAVAGRVRESLARAGDYAAKAKQAAPSRDDARLATELAAARDVMRGH